MTMNAAEQINAIQHNSLFVTIGQKSRFATMEHTPASVLFVKKPAPVNKPGIIKKEEPIDLGGLYSVSQKFKTLTKQDPLPIPSAVGQAIQTLAKSALSELLP